MLLAATLIGSLVLAIGVHQYVRLQISGSQQRIAALNAQLAQFKPQQAKVDAFKAKKAEIEQKLEVIARLERSRSGPVHILDELATRTPDRVWLTQLSANDGQIQLEGMSLDNELVALFLTALNDSPYFANVELKTTELKLLDALKLNTFKVMARLESPDEPASAERAPAPAARPAARQPARGAAKEG
jgi:type IV pilus assembly protein PilN